MTGPLLDTAATKMRRADRGLVRLGRRDIGGLISCAVQPGALYDLRASVLSAGWLLPVGGAR
jgi:hypothetical protein